MRPDLPLTPQDFFVLSRIEGPAAIHEIALASGLDDGAVGEVLERLAEYGLVRRLEGANGKGVGSTVHAQRAHRQRKHRKPLRERVIEQNLANFARGEGDGASGRGQRRQPAAASPATGREQQGAEVPATKDERSVWERIMLPEDAPGIDPSLDIPVEEQRLLLGIEQHEERLTAFDILGIAPTTDVKAIRRAYFAASRHFHPDRYYQRNTGPFADLMRRVFERCRRSYEALLDDRNREAYVEALRAREAQLRTREEAERADRKAEAAAADERAEEERRRAREDRDRRRRARFHERLRHRLKAKAQEHFRRGQALEARERWSDAAVAYRMAMEVDPSDETCVEAYERAQRNARKARADRLVQRGWSRIDVGDVEGAADAFRGAADALPSPMNLALAAWTVARSAPKAAGEYAMRALATLDGPEGSDAQRTPEDEGLIRALLAHGLSAAGNEHLAAAQADRARKLAGNVAKVRGILDALKTS